jgi:hypothetical protein
MPSRSRTGNECVAVGTYVEKWWMRQASTGQTQTTARKNANASPKRTSLIDIMSGEPGDLVSANMGGIVTNP